MTDEERMRDIRATFDMAFLLEHVKKLEFLNKTNSVFEDSLQNDIKKLQAENKDFREALGRIFNGVDENEQHFGWTEYEDVSREVLEKHRGEKGEE